MPDGDQKRSSSSFHFAAGLSTGILSATLLQPIDLLKTRVQQSPHTTLLTTLRSITSSPRPLHSLWRGTLPSVIRTGFGSALYFSSLNALRQHLSLLQSKALTTLPSSSSLPHLPPLSNLATGAFARASAGFLLMPLTVLKVRYESSLYSYTSLPRAALSVLRTEGLRGLYVGYGATAVRDAPYAGLYVLFYEGLKGRLSALARKTQEVGGIKQGGSQGLAENGMGSGMAGGVHFMSGVVAAVGATAITNPFDAVKTRLQLMPGTYENMWKAGRRMVGEEGWRSLFEGLGLRMGRKAVSSALAWTVYEELVRRAERWGDVL